MPSKPSGLYRVSLQSEGNTLLRWIIGVGGGFLFFDGLPGAATPSAFLPAPNAGRFVPCGQMPAIHLLGAPGSGVTTLGRTLAGRLNIPHFDTDDYHWFTEDALPYRRRRNPEHRRQLLELDLDGNERWVLSGALCGWGDVFIPRFQAVIYLWLPAELRLARIREREMARYGPDRLAPSGELYTVFEKFCTWAAAYDDPSEKLRSRARELAWLGRLPCPVLRIEEELNLEDTAKQVLGFLSTNCTD